MKYELEVPPKVVSAERAYELVRIWAADGAQHVSIATEIWEDPAAWGIALADLARHLANAYQLSRDLPKEQALARIREGFDTEWGTPTTPVEGDLLTGVDS